MLAYRCGFAPRREKWLRKYASVAAATPTLLGTFGRHKLAPLPHHCRAFPETDIYVNDPPPRRRRTERYNYGRLGMEEELVWLLTVLSSQSLGFECRNSCNCQGNGPEDKVLNDVHRAAAPQYPSLVLVLAHWKWDGYSPFGSHPVATTNGPKYTLLRIAFRNNSKNCAPPETTPHPELLPLQLRLVM